MKKGTYEDQIRIEELEVYAHHGVYPEENEKGQHFYVNATLYTNTRPAGLADDLSLSTNYGEVCQFITEFMQQHTFQLIETVAERTAYEVLQHFPLVQGLDLEIINCLEELNRFGYPLLLGCSRKSVIGLTLDLPVTERVEGTLVTTMFGVQKGCMFVRVHDVKENVRTIKMCEAILNSSN